jgi:chitinase
MYALADEMARLFPGWEEFPKIMKEWDADQHALASENAQTFMASRTADVLDRFTKIDLATAPEHIRQLINGAKKMASETDKLKFDTSGV